MLRGDAPVGELHGRGDVFVLGQYFVADDFLHRVDERDADVHQLLAEVLCGLVSFALDELAARLTLARRDDLADEICHLADVGARHRALVRPLGGKEGLRLCGEVGLGHPGLVEFLLQFLLPAPTRHAGRIDKTPVF